MSIENSKNIVTLSLYPSRGSRGSGKRQAKLLGSAIEDRVDLNEDRSTEFDRDRGVVVCVDSRGTSSDVGVLVENGDVDRDGGDG